LSDILVRLQAALADRYNLERELGRGGMATVYLARDLKHERPVAIKVLHPELGMALGPERFLREIRYAARLQHPHILTLLDSGECAGLLWYTMPYVEGESLRDRLQREVQLDLDDSLRIAYQVAQALGYAHEHGVIHRDVKPENILLAKNGTLVADFGIAKALEAPGIERLTETGLSLGTPAYMSPEQTADSRQLDGRSDLYALGCVVYEMLAGQPPFTGPTAQSILARHAVDPVPSLRTIRPTVPRGVETAIVKAMAKVPADRYAGMAQFAEALTRAEPARTPNRRLPAMILGGLILTAAVLALLAGSDLGGLLRGLRGEPAVSRIRSLAVLPLESLSSDSSQEYLAVGMTDELITNLAQLGALRVIARTSVMRYKGSKKTLPEIAHELHVDALVAGTVQRVGDRVRVGAQLIPAVGDQAVWANSYAGDVRDILALQSRVAQAIAQQIRVAVTPAERVRLTTVRQVDPRAYEAYVRGRYFLGKRTKADFQRAVDYFMGAINADPTYAAAYSGLADSYNMLGYYTVLAPKEAYPKALSAARKALELDSTLADAHASLAWALQMFTWDWPVAGREYRRAIELNPGYVTGHAWYGTYLAAMGQHDQAIAEGKRAQELDPLSLITSAALARPFYNARRYDDAIAQSKKTFEIDPRYHRAFYWLGLAYEQKSMFDQAVAAFHQAIIYSDSVPLYVAAAGHAYAAAGRRPQALKVLQRLEALSSKSYVSAFDIALIHLGLGDMDRAVEWLERAYQERSDGLVFLNVDPRLDRLRLDPRFGSLVRRVGLPL
jgi:eukaryotic-like serine/threonine-protein kinase